jgi:enterochelin esterase family protein
MPDVLAWLWRDYDPAKTQQTFEQDAREKAKPFFRVRVYNRD